MTWLAIALTALGCLAFKAAGWLLPPTALHRSVVRRGAELLPVALLAALVVVQAFGARRALALDARAVGLAAGAVALLLRAPFLVVVIVAATTAAALRAL